MCPCFDSTQNEGRDVLRTPKMLSVTDDERLTGTLTLTCHGLTSRLTPLMCHQLLPQQLAAERCESCIGLDALLTRSH